MRFGILLEEMTLILVLAKDPGLQLPRTAPLACCRSPSSTVPLQRIPHCSLHAPRLHRLRPLVQSTLLSQNTKASSLAPALVSSTSLAVDKTLLRSIPTSHRVPMMSSHIRSLSRSMVCTTRPTSKRFKLTTRE